MPKTFICENCGSDNVRKDAYADWDPLRQEWVLGAVFDNAVCEDCGDEQATLIEAEVTLGNTAVPTVRIITPFNDIEIPLRDLKPAERNILASLLGTKEARQEAFKLLRTIPKFKKIRPEDVWKTCPKGAYNFPVEFELEMTGGSIVDTAARNTITEFMPGAETTTAIHRMKGYCRRCKKEHSVEKHTVMVKTEVAGVPFSQLFEV